MLEKYFLELNKKTIPDKTIKIKENDIDSELFSSNHCKATIRSDITYINYRDKRIN